VITGIDLDTFTFLSPERLWLLLIPVALLGLWVWQLSQRRRDALRLPQHRGLERLRVRVFGDLLFWLCAIFALTSTILALAQPAVRVSTVRTGGIDMVILQDGSSSMHVEDVVGNSWRRSMRFLRTLAETLSWKEDRIALALFATIAAPQVRLTKDPNTFFFFLDHLTDSPPFRLEDDTTWDTNIERGIYWGVRLIERDEQLNGRSPNAKIFVLISDGQAWTGEVKTSIELAKDRNIPLFVIGVGTSGGGFIPEPPEVVAVAGGAPPVHSVLDRASLMTIATAGNGGYFEMDRESDFSIASSIVGYARRRAGTRGVQEENEEIYRRFLLVAGALLVLGTLFLRETTELWIQVLGAAGTMLIVWILLN
jgi:Ca-activated chloride channel family protein